MLQINSQLFKKALCPGIARLLSSSQCPGPPTQLNPVALGQPHPTTHPHLFDAVDQVNPGISREEFQSRRNGLAGAVLRHFKETQTSRNKLRSYGLNAPPDEPNSHLIVVPAACRSYMIDKIPYFFRQDTDFRYLTGCLEPDCILALSVGADSSESFMFFRDANSKEERWEGARSRPDEPTLQFFGFDSGYHVSDFERFLYDYQFRNSGNFVLWYDFAGAGTTHPQTHSVMQGFIQARSPDERTYMESPKGLLHELRLIKSSSEIHLMRRSAEVAAEAMSKTMSATTSCSAESQLFATMDYHCRMGGAQHLAYPPVVAYGDNANVIHYINNTQSLSPDTELVLMDAGCEYNGYASDITRTWPVNGRFSEAQRIVYEIVLDVQLRLLEKLTQMEEPMTVDVLYKSMQMHLGRALVGEGLVKGKNLTAADIFGLASEYCPHHVAHYLGMDVHDTPTILRSEPLRPGMIITVEPGLYISRSDPKVPPEFRGIGVRIEDDVLITASGPEVLSAGVPKSVQDIEELVLSGTSNVNLTDRTHRRQ